MFIHAYTRIDNITQDISFKKTLLRLNRKITDKAFTLERNVLSDIINPSMWEDERLLVTFLLMLITLF